MAAPQGGSARIPRGKAGRLLDRAFASARADAPGTRDGVPNTVLTYTSISYTMCVYGCRIVVCVRIVDRSVRVTRTNQKGRICKEKGQIRRYWFGFRGGLSRGEFRMFSYDNILCQGILYISMDICILSLSFKGTILRIFFVDSVAYQGISAHLRINTYGFVVILQIGESSNI